MQSEDLLLFDFEAKMAPVANRITQLVGYLRFARGEDRLETLRMLVVNLDHLMLYASEMRRETLAALEGASDAE